VNIFLYELKALRKSIAIWVFSIASFLVMYMAFFPAFSQNAVFLDAILENYPEEMLKAMGLSGNLPLSNVIGYFAFTFTFIQLMLAIQSSIYGFGILSAEERDMTADFLLTKPVSRSKIILSKFMAAFLALGFSNGIVWVSSFLSIEIFRGDQSYERSNVMVVLSSIVLFQLFYLCVGMLISVLVKKIRSVISFSMALAFGTYIINAVRAIIEGEILGFITPFYYFDPQYILEHGTYDTIPALVAGGVILLSGTLCYRLYLRRNIHSL
jgi:ABC-2 type transport system permease protein